MLSGELKTVVDTGKLNISMLQNAVSFFKDKQVVCNLHDFSPIRKPESKQLGSLGVVRDLDNILVPGYDTFCSMMVDVKGKSLRLLSITPFSNGEENFVSRSERYAFERGRLDSNRSEQIACFDAAGTSFNQKDVVFNQLKSINTKIKAEHPGLTVIDIFDRGFDDTALFDLQATMGNEFIVRGKANRNGDELQVTREGKVQPVKLIRQTFTKGDEQAYQQIIFKGRTYKNATGVFEWNEVRIGSQVCSVLRVRFYKKDGSRIFKDDMLLITSMYIADVKMACTIWELYMQRSKAEAVFRFCKQELGWETPRIHDWTTMQNLLSMVYFIAGYFYEIEDQLAKDPSIQWLAQLGNGKGKVTPHFILKGIAKLIAFLEIQKQLEQNQIQPHLLQMAQQIYDARNNL